MKTSKYIYIYINIYLHISFKDVLSFQLSYKKDLTYNLEFVINQSVYSSGSALTNNSLNFEKRCLKPDTTKLDKEFLEKHPFNYEMPDGTFVHFAQEELDFFDIFFSQTKYPRYKKILETFSSEKSFQDIQTELHAVINMVDVDIRRSLMSGIVGRTYYICQIPFKSYNPLLLRVIYYDHLRFPS